MTQQQPAGTEPPKKGKHVVKKMAAKEIEAIAKRVADGEAGDVEGYYSDGDGLYLRVKAGKTSWTFFFHVGGRRREMGLGAYPRVSLAEARGRAAEASRTVRDGGDPISQRQEARRALILISTRPTFRWCADEYIRLNRSGWKNAKHADQWISTLDTYVHPIIGKKFVSDITRDDVRRVIEPIWETKNETASRVRGRIESILDFAKSRNYRNGDNPAEMKAGLENDLSKISRAKRIKHRPALPYAELGAFMVNLRKAEGVSAKALEFAILTAARSGEVRGATWSEIDQKAGRWIIPKERMKADREHVVPLSPTAKKILKAQWTAHDGDPDQSALIFPGRDDKALSDMSLLAVLKRMKRNDITVHGFRSTFRDWAGETVHAPREVIEHALAHGLPDKTEAAYARGTLLEKRAALMNKWDSFTHRVDLVTDKGNVSFIFAA